MIKGHLSWITSSVKCFQAGWKYRKLLLFLSKPKSVFPLPLEFHRKIPDASKCSPLKNLANFWEIYREIWHDIFHTRYTFTYSQIRKVSLHCLQKGQNYAAFSHGNSAVETLSKIVSTIQDSANTVSLLCVKKNAQNVFRHLHVFLSKYFYNSGQLC